MASPDAPAAPSARRENQVLTLARIPVVRRLWAAITLSSLGDWLGLLANTALAQQLTREQSGLAQGAAISGVILVKLAPDLFFGPIAAALADKLDRRKIVIIGDTAAGLLYASIAFGYNLVWLYVAQFVIEAVGLFTQPCKQVIQVTIVPKRLLATANQISLFSVYGTVPVAAGLFALLSAANRLISAKSTVGPADVNAAIVIALLINTVTFFVSAATVFVSRHEIPGVPADREQGQSIVSLLREGISYIRGNDLIRGLYVGIIGAFAGGGLIVGVAQLWVRTLGGGAAGYSIMFGTVFGGLAVGMLVGPRVLPSFARSRVFGFAIGGAGVSLLVMSLIRDFTLAVALAAMVGLFAGMAWIIGYTMIGLEVEDRMRGRIFSFVLSSVRLMLLLTIAVGPVVSGLLGSHAIKVGRSHLRFSGPGLTLLLGGLIALGVSFYATSRAGRGKRLRDVVRGRIISSSAGYEGGRSGLLLTVDGLDPASTARYTTLLAGQARRLGLIVVETAEPTDTPTGRAVAALLTGPPGAAGDTLGVGPETAALLSAADRAEHVATVIRPALERGEVVVCDRYVLTSLAVHGGGHGGDADGIRDVNTWSTNELWPDLTVVVDPETTEGLRFGLDLAAVRQAYADEMETHPNRVVRCVEATPDALPAPIVDGLQGLVAKRASQLTYVTPSGEQTDPVPLADPGVVRPG